MQDENTRNIQIALGQRIRKLRKAKGYSQEGFADATGLHRTWMGSLERGERNLSFHNLVRIARTLGITLSVLVSGVERLAQAGRPTANSGPPGKTPEERR